MPEGVKEMIARRLAAALARRRTRCSSVARVVGRQFDLDAARGAARRRRRARRARGGDRGRAGPRGRRARPLRLRARARARDALRAPEHEPPRAPAPAHRRGAGGRRRREPGRARLPLPRGPGAAGRRLRARRGRAGRRRARLRGGGRALPARRTTALATLLALGAAELRAGDPAARATFAAAAELAREREDRDALAEAALGFAGRHAEAGVDRPRGASRCSRRRSTRFGTGDHARRAAARAAGRPAPVRAPGPRALALSAEALEMAQRLGDPRALLVALESPPRRAAARRPPRRAAAAERGAARAGGADRRARAGGARPPLAHLRPARGRPRRGRARRAHRRLATLAAELRQPLYNHFAVGWEVVWAQMAGRVDDAERLAREAFELGRRAQARDAETIFAAQMLILRRREDALSRLRGDDRGLRRAATRRCSPGARSCRWRT